MEKTIGALVDELSITNIKIFYLVDKVQKDEHTREDAKKIQDLNKLRSDYVNAINRYFKEAQQIKV
jgi:intergrase/recombinase